MIDKSINLKRNNIKERMNNLSDSSFSVSSFKNSINYNISNNNQENSKIILRIKPKTDDEYLQNEKIFEIKDNNLIEFIGSNNNSKIFKFDYIFNEEYKKK